MPPYAICSSPTCAYLFDFRDEEESQPSRPLEFCPVCPGKVIFHCSVCFWALLVIPRQDIPMCWNCYARLRQDEDLVGEKLAIRKIIVRAALQSAKIVNKAYRNPNIVLDRISQECLLIVDLYRGGGEFPVEAISHSSPYGPRKSIRVGGTPCGTGIDMHSSEENLPKGRGSPSQVVRRRRADGNGEKNSSRAVRVVL